MITVTAATGQLGRLVLEELLARGLPADQIVAAVRTPEKAADLAGRGIHVREADYDKPATLASAFTGAGRLLCISSNEFGRQAEQHANVIRAAKEAGATALIYTSYLNADSSGIAMAEPHARTEELIRASGIPYAILRNGSYIENYTANLGMWLQYGTVIGSAGDGKISGATRADLAAAAALVTADQPMNNRIHELGGSAFTMSDLAAETTAQTGTTVTYADMPQAEYSKTLASVGLPQFLTDAIADSSAGAARGAWYTDSRELQNLLGRPTTSVKEAIGQALAQHQG
ncbi:NAD(P)H-binding protein [Streptomyces sp. KM273126]|uniref:NAD(P)H-binding protein n=1 Tax=Streptomyces sp. KM273126 TaxID=2545247 RepID=UPI00103E5D52|nr:NAD(P)H-binding protein [Streptomyces sp. KM273126]MBA2813748.1 NAD(P)H-binding protein [Streptomyces sp. KM273126]